MFEDIVRIIDNANIKYRFMEKFKIIDNLNEKSYRFLLKRFMMFFVFCCTSFSLFGQKKVSGVVSSNEGPLFGVTVIVKGTKKGVSTNFNGEYTIDSLNDNDVLQFSYIGFQSMSKVVGNQSTIDILLKEDATQLEEAIVIGYGTKKRAELTSSVAQVKGEEIKRSPAVNYASSLAGRLPGLFINQRTSDPGDESVEILIRGKGTFGNNAALVVVDGVVGRDGLDRLDPQDIESVSVVKDASASVYGARAANGVILVTTKRGVQGKPIFSYRTSLTIASPTRVVEGATPYNFAVQSNAIRERNGRAVMYTPDELQNFKSGAARGIDFWKELFDKTSVEKRHNLSLRGGSESVSYFTSLGVVNQGAILNRDDVTDFSQYNVRSNIDISPNKDFTVGLDLAGRLEEVETPRYLFQVVDNASKIIPVYEFYEIDDKYIRLENQENPFAFLQKHAGDTSRRNTLFNGTLKLDYALPFLEGLSISTWGAVDYRQNHSNTFSNDPRQYILNADGSLTEGKLGLDRKVEDQWYKLVTTTYNARLGYKNSFGLHNVESFVAYEQSETKITASTLSRRGGFISEDLPYLSQGDPATEFTASSLGDQARQAYIGRLSYDYDGKYLASFGFRYDGSYIFSHVDRQQFGFFPYASAGWVLTKEGFLENSKTINFLKLRGSWGITGNDLILPFQYLQRFANPEQNDSTIWNLGPNASNNSAIPIGGTNQIILSPTGRDPNPLVTWETKTSWDLGLEANLFSDKVNLELIYFSEERKDILANRNITIPGYTGLRPPSENIGETKNHGIEAVLGYRTNIGEVQINVEGNVSFAENELVFNDAPDPEEDYQDLQGHPIGSKLVYNAIGIYKTEDDLNNYPSRPGTQIGDLIYVDTNDDGQITTADRIVLEESTTPTIQYGINLEVLYNNFSLSTFWQGQNGSVLQIASFLDEQTSSADYFAKNAWTVDNPNAILPAVGGAKSILNGYYSYDNNFFTYDTSFVRLKNVQLAYDFDKELTNQIGLDEFRIFVSGHNLLTFSKFNDLGFADVEQTVGLGYHRPLRKLFSFGIEVKF